MKNSTKSIASAVVVIALFLSVNVKAQLITPNKFRFGVGVEGGYVTGDAHNASNVELGGTGRLQYGFSNHLALTLTSGYYNFFGKSYTDVNGTNQKYQSLGMVPIKAGLKAFLTNNFYVGGEVGAGIETKTFAPQGVDQDVIDDAKHTRLILSPGIGYASKHWDVGARYENFSGAGSNYGLVGLRLAYGFGL